MTTIVDPVRSPTGESQQLAKALLRDSRYASFAFTDTITGGPSISRIIIADLPGFGLVTLISDLSAHSQALAHDSRCALLIGEPGKGDPLAHPRMSIVARAERLPQTAKEDAELAKIFLNMHPKAELYFNFPDFAFWRLSIIRLDLNGGFGKASRMTPDDLN